MRRGIDPFVPKSSEGKRTMILESNVVREGTAAVVPPFEEAVGEDEATFGSDQVTEGGFLVNGFRTCIECANSKLGGGCGFFFHPTGNKSPRKKLDSISVFVGDDGQIRFGEARNMIDPGKWDGRVKPSVKPLLQGFEAGNRVVVAHHQRLGGRGKA